MKDVLKNLPPLVDTVTVKVANVTKYDDNQVEIREADTNLLIWRAWDFEPDFEYNFKQQLQRFIKN
ncbi:DUF905 domain-containing protein [Salmonella enterica subsp. enterica serovar Saintpaul]|nr:DUF905 domain-containing protein [Salmonella enterica subsp. enterica serovar Saintpaul]